MSNSCPGLPLRHIDVWQELPDLWRADRTVWKDPAGRFFVLPMWRLSIFQHTMLNMETDLLGFCKVLTQRLCLVSTIACGLWFPPHVFSLCSCSGLGFMFPGVSGVLLTTVTPPPNLSTLFPEMAPILFLPHVLLTS